MSRTPATTFAVVAVLLAAPCAASDLVGSRAVLEDPSGTLTIGDVAGRVTVPAGPTLPLTAPSPAVHWLCLRVRAPAHGTRVVLQLRPPFLEEVRLYEAAVGPPQAWKTRATGGRVPLADRDLASASLGFLVDVPGPEGTFYLRVRSEGATPLRVEALEQGEAERADHQRDLLMVFFLTSMLGLVLWGLFGFILDRQRVVGLLALHQLAFMAFGAISAGYATLVCPAGWAPLIDGAGGLLYFAINVTTLLFALELFRPYAPPPALVRGLRLLLWSYPVLLVALALGHERFAVAANAVLIKVTWASFVVVAFTLRREHSPSRRVLQAIFGAVLANNVVWYVSRATDTGPVFSAGMRLLIVDGLIVGGLLAVVVHARARQARREAQQTALELAVVQRDFEVERRLKREAEARAHTDFLTGLLSRRRFVELAEAELGRAGRLRRPLALLMIDVDRFKSINDGFGHHAGDAVLKAVAGVLRDSLREVDLCGRTGGEEFCALLLDAEGPLALRIAERLREAVAQAAFTVPGAGRTSVTVSIGVADARGREVGLEALMHEADRAMYVAKQLGRNRVAVHDGGHAASA